MHRHIQDRLHAVAACSHEVPMCSSNAAEDHCCFRQAYLRRFWGVAHRMPSSPGMLSRTAILSRGRCTSRKEETNIEGVSLCGRVQTSGSSSCGGPGSGQGLMKPQILKLVTMSQRVQGCKIIYILWWHAAPRCSSRVLVSRCVIQTFSADETILWGIAWMPSLPVETGGTARLVAPRN